MMDNFAKVMEQKLSDSDRTELVKQVFQLHDEQLGTLKAEVQQTGGLVMVFVHPYFQSRHFFVSSGDKRKKLELRIDAFIASESRKKPPIFMLEEKGYVQKTARRLYKIAPGTIVHVIATQDNAPDPVLSINGRDMSWDALRLGFHYLGVKKILVGGTSLDRSELSEDTYTPEGRRDWENYAYCVGGTLRELGKQFEVEVSSFTHPLLRKDVHQKPS